MLAFAAACSKYFFTHTELLDYTPESDKRSTARPAWLRNMLRFVGSKKADQRISEPICIHTFDRLSNQSKTIA